MSKIQSFFHDTGKGQLFCTLIGDSSTSNECTIYLAPLFEERMWSQRIAFNFALELWKNQRQPVFMFDYFGYGESDGDTEDFSLLRFRQDLRQIFTLLKTRYTFLHFTLWGIRTGSALVFEGLSLDPAIVSLVLWSPVLNLKDYVYSQLRSTLASQAAVFRKIHATRDDILNELLEYGKCEREGYLLNHIDGYRIGKAFYQEILQWNHNNLTQKLNIPALLVDIISPKGSKNSHGLTELQKTAIEELNYQKVEANPFWLDSRDYSQRSEDVYRISLQWYSDCLNHT